MIWRDNIVREFSSKGRDEINTSGSKSDCHARESRSRFLLWRCESSIGLSPICFVISWFETFFSFKKTWVHEGYRFYPLPSLNWNSFVVFSLFSGFITKHDSHHNPVAHTTFLCWTVICALLVEVMLSRPAVGGVGSRVFFSLFFLFDSLRL